MKKQFKTPILFLAYNRPLLTKKVFEKIRQIKPKYLFISADGPKDEKDNINCESTRDIFTKIDWPCKVERRFLDKNQGCSISVSSGITWFFSKVDKGIILEDDCLPETSFFYFCEKLLNKYKNNEEIMMIAGTNLLGEWKSDNQDYHFSRQIAIWGWATWKRAWKGYSHNLESLKDKETLDSIERTISNPIYYRYIIDKINKTLRGEIDSWGYRWIISCYINKGKIITPSKNLITNIGFHRKALHTKNPFSWMSRIKSHKIKFPLREPKSQEVDKDFHNKIIKKITNPLHRLINKLFSYIG
jgi:hypothetical protein